MLLDVDAWTAAHLAAALRVHRQGLRRQWQEEPPGLAVIERACAVRARGGQRTPRPAPADGLGEGGRMVLLLKPAQVAAVLAVSERTIARLIASGALPTVRVEASRRVHRDDLEAYVNGLRDRTAAAAATNDRTSA